MAPVYLRAFKPAAMPLNARTHLRDRYMDEQLGTAALEYHRSPTPGKISLTPSATTRRIVNMTALTVIDPACSAASTKPCSSEQVKE